MYIISLLTVTWILYIYCVENVKCRIWYPSLWPCPWKDQPSSFQSTIKSLLRARSILWLAQNCLEPFSTRILPKGLGQLFSEHKPLLLALVLGLFSFLTKNMCPEAPVCLRAGGLNRYLANIRLIVVPCCMDLPLALNAHLWILMSVHLWYCPKLIWL